MLFPSSALEIVRTPKRRAVDSQCRSKWFSYYAGFSAGFVEDIIRQLHIGPGSTLLDPWLGSGTTAEIALTAGVDFKGFDLNPSMLLVAKARTFPAENASQLLTLIETAASTYERRAARSARLPKRSYHDPLEQWLQPGSAAAFRALECIVANLDGSELTKRPAWSRVKHISPAASVLYVALYRTLRHFISRFQGSNPTWIKLCDGPRV